MAGLRPGGARAAAAAATVPATPPPGPGWYDAEPALGPTAGATTSRLARRARASWRTWVSGAFILAAIVTVQRARTPPSYEVTKVLRVVEGAVDGPALSEAEIVAQVDDLAFTKDRLLGLMKKHPANFPKAFTDQSLALDDFHDRMKVEVSEDDFIEDRQPTDPRRSARVTLSFKAPDPDLAWTVARELQEMLVDSGLQQQRDRAKSGQAAAAEAVRGAELDVAAAQRDALPGVHDKRLEMARARLLLAQQNLAEASITVTATTARLALRFDVIDPGRRPPVPNRRAVLVGAFATALFLGLLALALLAGAFDPRVLNAGDLADLGVPLLGRFPVLPPARDGRAATQSE
jgi:hypothetical protein